MANNAEPTRITLVTNLWRVNNLKAVRDYVQVVLSRNTLSGYHVALNKYSQSAHLSPSFPVETHIFSTENKLFFPPVQEKLPLRHRWPWRSVWSLETWAAATSLRAGLTATTQSAPSTPGPVTTGLDSSRYEKLTSWWSHHLRIYMHCNTLWTLSSSDGVVFGEGLPHVRLGTGPTQLWRGHRGQLLCTIPGYWSTWFMFPGRFYFVDIVFTGEKNSMCIALHKCIANPETYSCVRQRKDPKVFFKSNYVTNALLWGH